MKQDFGRIDAGESRDDGIHAMPKREDIAGMKSTVLELVDGGQGGEGIELGQLANAGQMEESV